MFFKKKTKIKLNEEQRDLLIRLLIKTKSQALKMAITSMNLEIVKSSIVEASVAEEILIKLN